MGDMIDRDAVMAAVESAASSDGTLIAPVLLRRIAATPAVTQPDPDRYGKRNVSKMIQQVETLRQIIRAEGTPAIQDAWDKVEEHIDYAYRKL